jgi:lipopolysaccharide transport system ATP-binding protein
LPTTFEREVDGETLPDDVVVHCVGLEKHYVLGEELSLQHSLASLPFVPARFGRPLEMLPALGGATFTVRRGEFFGIVGANGSGKSTLTQIISGIAVPTGGRAYVRGRVLPLLEVGAGFHGDLTGAENVILLGTILGLTRPEIDAVLPDIAQFAGVERHLNTPLKRFSSGMQARLSFAVASRFPADIYVFDEVLAVVDDAFRERCARELRRINREGRTIIFMSHDLNLVTAMCSTGMWLDKGVVRATGPIRDVARAYVEGPAADG